MPSPVKGSQNPAASPAAMTRCRVARAGRNRNPGVPRHTPPSGNRGIRRREQLVRYGDEVGLGLGHGPASQGGGDVDHAIGETNGTCVAGAANRQVDRAGFKSFRVGGESRTHPDVRRLPRRHTVEGGTRKPVRRDHQARPYLPRTKRRSQRDTPPVHGVLHHPGTPWRGAVQRPRPPRPAVRGSRRARRVIRRPHRRAVARLGGPSHRWLLPEAALQQHRQGSRGNAGELGTWATGSSHRPCSAAALTAPRATRACRCVARRSPPRTRRVPRR